MAYTLAQYNELVNAIATGAEYVSYENGRSVKYRSSADLMRLKATMEAELEASEDLPVGSTPPRRSFAKFSRGY
jgi:hypothetical protein